VICLLSLAVAVGLNVNTIGIGERLAKDGAVRAAVVSLAEKTTLKEGAKPKEAASAVANEVGKVQQLGVPLGWNKKPGDPAAVEWNSVGDYAHNIGGWLLTFLALSLGAPFWFGVLGKLSNLRTSGGNAEAAGK
jgi:hypothetical protein